MARKKKQQIDDDEYYNALNKLVDRLFELASKQGWTWQKLSEESGVGGPTIDKISALVGVIIGFLGVSQLGRFGAVVYVPELVVVAHFRELGPLVTAERPPATPENPVPNPIAAATATGTASRTAPATPRATIRRRHEASNPLPMVIPSRA